MIPTQQPDVIAVTNNDGFPTAAIVVIAIGSYLVLFVVGLIIRQFIINNDYSCCPDGIAEFCQCQPCCNNNPEDEGFVTKCARSCDWKIPTKKTCMDRCCPTKEWCDDTFCFMFSKQPEGQCCKCDDKCCSCGECGECCDCKELCPDCKDCFDDCQCQCCAQPETIDCCCIEVKLAGNRDQRQAGPPGAGPGNYINQGGNMMNQGGYFNQYPGVPIQQQPSQQMSVMGQPPVGHLLPSFNAGSSFNPGVSFNTGQQPAGPFYSGQINQLGDRFNQSQTFNQQNLGVSSGGMFQAPSVNQNL